MTENPYERWLGTDNDFCLPVIDQQRLNAILGETAARVFQGLGHLRAVHQTLASGRAVTTKLPILTVVQRIPSGPNGIQRIPAESPANDAPSLASCNWCIPTGNGLLNDAVSFGARGS